MKKINENKANKKNALYVLVLFFAFLIIWFIWQLHYNYIIGIGDTFFHMQRIYEMRDAFKIGSFPNWLNFSTFHFMGQAVNGMYPDITLWPIVISTNMLTPIHQIVAIRLIIVMLSCIFTYVALCNNGHDEYISAITGVIYATSGFILYSSFEEFQPGVAICCVFAFPLFFSTYNIFCQSKFNFKNIIRFSLIISIIMYSHFLTVIVIALLIFIFVIINFIINKNIRPITSFFCSVPLIIVMCLPVFYRYLKINSSELLAPYGEGNISTGSFVDLFQQSAWSTRISIPLVSLIAVFLIIFFGEQKKRNKVQLFLMIEFVIMILCTNLFPWELMNKVPFIKNMQFTPWRFGPFLGVMPLLMLINSFDNKKLYKILRLLSLISIIAAFSTVYTYQHSQQSQYIITKHSKDFIPENKTIRLTSSFINSPLIDRTIVPDYLPKSVGSQSVNGGENNLPAKSAVEIEKKHYGLYTKSNEKQKMKLVKYGIGSVSYVARNIKSGDLQLPVYGYKSLKYDVYVRNKKVDYNVNENGYIQVKNVSYNGNTIFKVRFVNPMMYNILIFISVTIMFISVIYICFKSKRRNYFI